MAFLVNLGTFREDNLLTLILILKLTLWDTPHNVVPIMKNVVPPGSRDWRLASGASSSAANIISGGPLSESDGGATTFCLSALYRRDIRFPPINRRCAGIPPENFRLKNIAYGGPLFESYGGPLSKFYGGPRSNSYGGQRSNSYGGATRPIICSSALHRRDICFQPINRRRAGVPPENFRFSLRRPAFGILPRPTG